MQAEACPEAVAAEVEGLLRALHPLLADAVPTVADNAIGAAARVAAAHAARLPLAPLVREILLALPIKADFLEMMPVVIALGELTMGRHAAALDAEVPAVLRALIACVLETRAGEETCRLAACAVRTLAQQHGAAAEAAAQGLDAPARQRLQELSQDD